MSAEALGTMLRPPAEALGVPDGSDRSFWDSIDHASRDALVEEAGEQLGRPWPIPLPGDYARYVLDGDRSVYEAAVFARERRTAVAVLAAALTEEPAFLREALDGVGLLCEQSSWCWPAHDDTHERHGSVLPTVTDPYLDLGAGEVVALLAWADTVLGPQLESTYPGIRARMRHEADHRVFDPFLERRDWWWLGITRPPINWSPWIHGNVLTAALRLVDDPSRRARIVALCLEGIDRFLGHLPADGAVDEGSAYWWEGAGRMLEALERLEVATRGTAGRASLDASASPRLHRIVAFPHRMQLGDDWFVNVADAPARAKSDTPWRTLFRWGRATAVRGAEQLARAHRRPGTLVCPPSAGLGRLVPALADAEWAEASPASLAEAAAGAEEDSALPRSVWYPSVQVAVDRARAGTSTGLALAVKGGTNDESHNHNDVGSFIVAVDGRPVIIDVGQPTYTAQTFGPDRYRIWVTQSGWHNLPVVRGHEQAPGDRFAAHDVRRTETACLAGLELELAKAYPASAGLESFRRTAALDRRDADHPRVTISDRWWFTGPEQADEHHDVEFHLIVGGCVTQVTNGVRIAPPDDARPVVVSWGEVPMDVRIEQQVVQDPRLSSIWGGSISRVVLVPGALPAAERPLSGRLDLTIELEG